MKRVLASFAVLAIALSGCGGGGGNPNIFGPQKVDTYLTDSFREDYDHVWITIYKAVIDGPVPATLFEDPNGRVIDLKTLRDASGKRYAFLDTAQVDAAVYSDLAITLGNSLVIVPAGSSTGQTREFADLHDDGAFSTLHFSMLGYSLTTGVALPIDFDLASWSLDGSGKVRASIKLVDAPGISSQTRHEAVTVRGTASAFTGSGPNLTFNLQRAGRPDLKVVTSNKTRIYFASGATSPALTDGSSVEVTAIGIGGTMVASRIEIQDAGTGNPDEVSGTASAPNEAAGTFRLAVDTAQGFTPTVTDYTIATNDLTKLLSDTGEPLTKAEFFAALAGAASVTVDGSPSGSGQFDATRVKIDADASLNQVAVTGPIAALSANVFSLTLGQWNGTNLRQGDVINATLGGSTVYVLNGTQVDKTTFFGTVGVDTVVRVEGLITDDTITALRVRN